MIDLARWPDADRILDAALDRPAGERAAYLRAEVTDPDLLAALEAVVVEASRADGFLDPDRMPTRPALDDLREALEIAPADALAPGDRVGQYEVVELAGRGGMGVVYRARDPRLGRDVALKTLPHAVGDDPLRLARFDREARVLASLNHPNIAGIYGVLHEPDRQALVLEFVEGVTLAERIAASGALPLRDALDAARQIALALDAAHQRGVVHRDLKPANIKVAPDGTVKVLDFGLAKALDPGAAAEAGDPGLTTHFRPAGAAMGTPAYMSPEQVRGQPADERADIWAFGCVLFEMLTGGRAFTGDATSDVMARVLEREPDFEQLPSATPEPVRRLLRRALTKDSKKRLASISDALLEIEEAFEERGTGWRRRRGLPPAAAWVAAGVLVLTGVVSGWWLSPLLRDRSAPAVRLAVPIPASEMLLVSGQPVAAISPDGATIVYRAIQQGEVRLFRRSLQAMSSDVLPGSENAAGPFFSPDGAWIGFDGDGVLRKVSMGGGAPVTICQAPGGANASWGGDWIVFATATGRTLQRVAASGGTPVPLTALDHAAGDLAHTFPHVMPAGDAALFTIVRERERLVAAVRFGTPDVTIVAQGSQARYIPGGYLLFVREDSLWVGPFDERRLELTGEAVPVLSGLETAGLTAQFAVSAGGTLVFVPRREESRARRLVWLTRDGREVPLPFEPRLYQRAALSPDGTRVALAFAEGDRSDIWVGDVQRGTLLRVTRDPTADTAPLWSPDGRFLIFRSERDGGGLFRRAADATGEIERVTSAEGTLHTPHGWGNDGRTLLFTDFRSYAEQVIAEVEPGSAEPPRHLLGGRFAQLRPQVSPDGRWLAYQSDESGRFEVYVRPFPALDSARWKASIDGGTSPKWSADGQELIYYDGRGFLSIPVRARGGAFEPGEPSRLFDYAPFSGRMGPDYDVTRDGGRFLMIKSGEDSPGSRVQLVVVQNWIRELKDKLVRQ